MTPMERMGGEARCPRCGDYRIETGSLRAQHGLGFRPDRKKFFSLPASVRLTATMCRACGHVEIEGDLKRLEEMLKP